MQDTLEEANAILLELEARDSKQSPQVSSTEMEPIDSPRTDRTSHGNDVDSNDTVNNNQVEG